MLQAKAEEVTGVYNASWAGLPAATIQLSLDDRGERYRAELKVATEGLPRWFTHFRTDVTADGFLKENGDASPSNYDAHYDLRRRKNNRIHMHFEPCAGGTIAKRSVGDTSHRPELSDRYRLNVIDPLSAMAFVRHQLRMNARLTGRRFTLPIYDGARRFDAVAQLQAADPKNHLIHLKLTLIPIAGFKGESSEDEDPDSAPRPLDFAFTDDPRLLPVYLQVSIAWFPFVVRFEHLCPALDQCAV